MSDGPLIKTYFHCSKCIQEKPATLSPQEYRRYDVGLTPEGIQVWCVRHNINVAHFKFDKDGKMTELDTAA